jgi:hypothetical protein
MANGLLDLLMQARESGRGARADLENSINYYIPPELRGLLGFAAEANPVVSMERAGQDAQRFVQPGLSGWDRMAAAGDMASNMAGVLAPMAAGRAVGMPAVRAAQEGLLGLSMTPEAAALRQFGVRDEGGMILPGSSEIDPATARGQEIMGMLSSGRAADITEDMFDLGDPVLNTRLNEYLYSNYDLPMDTASRMGRAQEMGLTAEMTHGTPYADITTLRPSEFGAVGPGVYATARPVTSSDYARGYGLMSPRDTFENMGERYTIGGNVMPIQTPGNLQSFKDWTDAKMADMQRQGMHFSSFRADDAATKAAQDAGFAGVAARNDNVVIFDPANIRSSFARFDPRLSHLRNLNAALTAGVPLGLLAMQPEQEQY